MGLFNRGQSISGMWLDGKPAIRAYLGDVLVWDGTTPAFVNVPRALVSALAVAPAVRADASMTADRALGSSSAIAPSLTAFATVDPETAVIVTAQAGAPVVRADSIIMVETITVGAQALPAVAAQSSAATVAAPAAAASVSTPAPSAAAHFATTVPAIAVNVSAQVPVITATGAAAVNVPVAAVNAMARVPGVSGNSSVGAFAVTADSSAKMPAILGSSNVTAVKATASSIAPIPVVQANNGPTISAYTTAMKTTASSVTITLPGANVGDLWVIAMGTVDGQMSATPSGWTKRLGNGSWYDTAIEVWTRTKVAGDPATLTANGAGFNNSPTEVVAMTVTNQNGVNASSSVSSSTSTSATPHPTPAITTTVANTVLIRMVSTGPQTAAHTWPAGVTPVASVINGTSGALSVAVQTADLSGSQAVVNATPSNGSKYSSATIAIAPV
ncbi:hypothetical protein RQN9TF_11275 [Rhodococcus qingshengii]|uniref:hypothetical protein n=1 Tax=Rhodococcus qingshengii TaxID=334542 RepID=UPI0021F92E2B|nr:hypothetical protein [Rhodococcus qingshengii]BDQ19783.1 hypothetical protein RQN9TF_11275 [Rhodococcus qingshengii]